MDRLRTKRIKSYNLDSYRNVQNRILNDPEVKEILDQNNWYAKVKKELCKYERTIEGNLKRMKAKSCTNGYLELVEAELKNIDSTVARYSSDNRVSPSGKPALLCKYMKKKHAVGNVHTGQTKFGSVKEYRNGDPMECTLPIDPNSEYVDLLGAIQSNIIMEVMIENGVDIQTIYSQFQERIQDRCFIGCFSDGSNSEYMWDQYADSDGICVWFEPDDSNLVKITYANYLEKASTLMERYQDLMHGIATKRDKSIMRDLENLTKEFIDLSIMSFYTKGPQYENETEWRIVEPCTSPDRIRTENGVPYILERIPGRIVRIESRMPEDFNERLIDGLDQNIDVVFSKPKRG